MLPCAVNARNSCVLHLRLLQSFNRFLRSIHTQLLGCDFQLFLVISSLRISIITISFLFAVFFRSFLPLTYAFLFFLCSTVAHLLLHSLHTLSFSELLTNFSFATNLAQHSSKTNFSHLLFFALLLQNFELIPALHTYT